MASVRASVRGILNIKLELTYEKQGFVRSINRKVTEKYVTHTRIPYHKIAVRVQGRPCVLHQTLRMQTTPHHRCRKSGPGIRIEGLLQLL